MTSAEATTAYDCLKKALTASYKKSGMDYAGYYVDWARYSTQPYQSGTHGGRYVNNYANAKGKAYGKFEKAGTMPVGAMMAKDSFMVTGGGKTGPGPLFMMEKMWKGFNKESGNWKYTMIMPDGAVFGTTGGKGSANVQFCADCHSAVSDQDHLYFLPEEYRTTSN